MKVIVLIFSFLLILKHSFSQQPYEIVIDKNLKLIFPNAIIVDSSEGDMIKYFSNDATSSYQLLTIDSFEVYSEQDMFTRLDGLLNVFKEKGITNSHSERRTDTIIGNAKGLYMNAIDTSGNSRYKKAEFFYTVQASRLYVIQLLMLKDDSINRFNTQKFFGNIVFFGKPNYTNDPTTSKTLGSVFWFVALVVTLGFLLKSTVEKKSTLY